MGRNTNLILAFRKVLKCWSEICTGKQSYVNYKVSCFLNFVLLLSHAWYENNPCLQGKRFILHSLDANRDRENYK